MSSRRRWIVPALGAVFVALALVGARHDSVTVDEFAIVPSGYVKLTHPGKVNWLNPGNPPLIEYLLASPWLLAHPVVDESWWSKPQDELRWDVGDNFMKANAERYDTLVFLPRLAAIGLGLLLVLFAWRWSVLLFGQSGGVITLALACLCPTLIANSHIASIDIGAAAFLVMAGYYFTRLLRDEAWRFPPAFAFALSFSLALGSKYTALLCAPMFVVVATGFAWRRRSRALAGSFARTAALTIAVTMVVLATLFGFDQIGRSGGDAAFASRLFAPLTTGPLSHIPIPLPMWYLKGLDTEANRIELVRNVMYYMGEVTTRKHASYFLVAILLKTPIGHLALIFAGMAATFATARRRGEEVDAAEATSARWRVGATLGLAAGFLALFSLGIGSNLGIRYVLFPLVVLYVAAGGVAVWVTTERRRAAVGGAIILSAVSLLSQSPYFLSYFNEAAGGPDGGRRFLGDSNIDWGQDLKSLRDEMQRRGAASVYLSYFGRVSPAVYGINAVPLADRQGRPGLVAISVQHLLGIDAFDTRLPEIAAPYRNRVPIGTAGHSILLFMEQ